MPDWRQLVRERLGALGLSPEGEDEVVAELADHLEECRAKGIAGGMKESEAVAKALQEVPDWVSLNEEISAAKKEGPMSVHTKKLVLPGMTMLISSAVLLFLIVRLVPPAAWFHPKAPAFFFAPWLLSYCVMGALGAYWSRREGGNTATRFLSGVFPLALHLAIFICVIFAAILGASHTSEHLDPSFLARAGFAFILLPGVALALGTLPFLRNGARQST